MKQPGVCPSVDKDQHSVTHPFDEVFSLREEVLAPAMCMHLGDNMQSEVNQEKGTKTA